MSFDSARRVLLSRHTLRIANLVQGNEVPVKSAQSKIVKCPLIVHFRIPAIIVTIPKALISFKTILAALITGL